MTTMVPNGTEFAHTVDSDAEFDFVFLFHPPKSLGILRDTIVYVF